MGLAVPQVPGPDAAATRAALDLALIEAHGRGDGRALVGLYARAATDGARAGDAAAEAFFLTQAYVFALEAGDPAADDLHARLVRLGRDE